MLEEDEDRARRATALLTAYRVLSRCYFHLSILFVFFLQRGMTTLQIESALALYGGAVAATSGASVRLAARFGSRWTLFVGELIKVIGLLALAVSSLNLELSSLNLELVFIGQVITGFGFGITSTAEPVVIAQVLGGSAEVGQFQARTQSLMFLSTLVAGIAGAAFFAWHETLPLVLSAGVTTLAAAIVFLFSEVERADASDRSPRARLSGAQTRAVSAYVVTRGFALAMFVGLLPLLLYQRLALSIVPMALALGAFSVTAFLSARYSQALVRALSANVVMTLAAAALSMSFITFAITDSLLLVLLAMTASGVATGVVRPVTLFRLSQIAEDQPNLLGLGYVVGVMERSFGLANAAVILIGGYLATAFSFRSAMILLAIMIVGFHCAICVSIRLNERPRVAESLG